MPLRERNPVLVIVFTLVTFVIYGLYWYYDVNSQFKSVLEDGSHPGLRTLALFVPLVNIVSLYKTSVSNEEATDGHDWLLTLLALLVLLPIGQFVIQRDINEALE